MFQDFQQVNRFFTDRKQYKIKPGLDRVNSLLTALDQPQTRVPAIHVAGTNGKGSTVHFLKHALMANGYHVGVFTSPSLKGLTGFVWLDNQPIPETDLLRLLNDLYPAIEALDQQQNHPTEFEIITVLAFYYFSTSADIALIEAGMGGREDTTNCFIPILSIITNIALDHMPFLGKTIQSIASHKAGIIKPNRPVVVGEVPPQALNVIQHEASQHDAPIYRYGHDFYPSDTTILSAQNIHFQWTDGINNHLIQLNMLGNHQKHNASLALMALTLVEQTHFTIDWQQACAGIADTRFVGRFEQIKQEPPIVIDGAHNPAGTKSFVDTVLQHYPDDDRHLLFAGFRDKALANMVAELLPHFTTITLTTFDHPRACSLNDLNQLVGNNPKLRVNPNWQMALAQYVKLAKHDCSTLFVTGSMHFILELRQTLVE